MLYEFKLGHRVITEATENICFAKDEGTVDQRTLARLLKKFRSGCKYLNIQVRSGRPKTGDFESVLEAIKPNPVSSTRRVSVRISKLKLVWQVQELHKQIELPNCASHHKNIAKPLNIRVFLYLLKTGKIKIFLSSFARNHKKSYHYVSIKIIIYVERCVIQF